MTLSDTQREAAINYLRSQVELVTLQQVNDLRHEPEWWVEYHFTLGMWVRNTLRSGGFDWGDLTFDKEWPALIGAVADQLAEGPVE